MENNSAHADSGRPVAEDTGLLPQSTGRTASGKSSIELAGGWNGFAAIGGNQGKYAVSKLGVSAKIQDFYLNYALLGFEWRDTNDIPFGNGTDEPWKEVSSIVLGYEKKDFLNDNWGYLGAVELFSAFEKEVEGSLGISLRGAAMYSPTRNWTFILGAGGILDEVRFFAYPVIGIAWKENAASTMGWAFSIGFPATEIKYAFNEMIGVRLGARADYKFFRMAANSTVRERGFVEKWDVSSGLFLDMTPLPYLSLSIGAEYFLYGRMVLFDNRGKSRNTYEIDPSPGATMKLKFMF